MRNFKTLLEKDIHLERQMLKFIAKELKTLPDGSLKTGKNGKAFHAEHLRHRNAKGEIVRSKSEYIFAMQYDGLKIPYNYEERIYWPQDAPPEAWEIKERLNIPDYYIPDFTFTMPDGTKKYHEHLGLMNSETYMETWKKKMILYYWAGVIPGKNLIITADDCHGGIDMQAIMPVIEASWDV